MHDDGVARIHDVGRVLQRLPGAGLRAVAGVVAGGGDIESGQSQAAFERFQSEPKRREAPALRGA